MAHDNPQEELHAPAGHGASAGERPSGPAGPALRDMAFYGDISGRPAAAFRMGHPPGFTLHTRSARELTASEPKLVTEPAASPRELSKPELVPELEEDLEEPP